MKYLTIAAVVATVAFAHVAIAQQIGRAGPGPTNKRDCEKARMKWDPSGGKDGKGTCIRATTATPAAEPADVKK